MSLLVAKVGLDILWDAVKEFTDAAPASQVLSDMKETACAVPHVLEELRDAVEQDMEEFGS